MKTKIMMAITIVIASNALNAQTLWEPSGGTGIGTTTNGNAAVSNTALTAPTNLFHVKVNGATTFGNNDGIRIEQTGTTAASLYLDQSTSGRSFGLFSTGSSNSQGAGNFIIRDIPQARDRLFIKGTNGYIGINTITPGYLLDVNGDGHYATKLRVDDQIIVNGGWINNGRVTAFSKTSPCFDGYLQNTITACGIFEGDAIGAIGIASPHANGTQQQSMGLWGIGWNFGIDHNYFRTVGVHGDAYAGPLGFNAGVYGSGYSFSTYCTTYGVLGDIDNTISCGYAGYFNGDLGGVGVFSYASDKKLKENISPIENAIEKIKQLQPSSYTFRQKEFPYMNFGQGTHYGFIAQEIGKIFPEVVKDDVCPPKYDNNGNLLQSAVEYKGVAYLEIIPILTAGIKEQQAKIETMENKIAELEKLLAGKNNLNNTLKPVKGMLLQNVPNPFDKTTRIDFSLPANFSSAYITIVDVQGKELQHIIVSTADNGSVTVSNANLKPGNYFYALYINNEKVDQKQFVVIK